VSRSRRKTPIFGYTSARSEADDKRLWHKRWRAQERNQLASLVPGDDPLPVHRQTVSSTWNMSKDGKHWFGLRRQREVSEGIANRLSQLKAERKVIQVRLLAKWQGK
jgi:hypothetical protein